jgi:hypothetical protein
MTLSIARRHAGTTARSRTFFGLFEHTRREGAQSGPRPQPNTPQLENREFYRDGQDEQDKSLNASLILFIPVKFLLLELSAHSLASKTRNLSRSMKALSAAPPQPSDQPNHDDVLNTPARRQPPHLLHRPIVSDSPLASTPLAIRRSSAD